MTIPPIPVVFAPIYKPKPWGGRSLASVLNKRLPGDDLIGEAWEIASLPDAESRVQHGPLAGHTISDLVRHWGSALLGRCELAEGRFPLLIKYLDAREHLSVQVHPRPAADDPRGWRPGIKHESWYVVHAEPDAELFIGLKPGVGPDDLAQAVNTERVIELLQRRPARPGQCFYLPSGTLHALGAGFVVAEVQTPSDVTYRLYDWGRVDGAGRPRALHISESLENIRFDVDESEIVQPAFEISESAGARVRIAACERFMIDRLRLAAGPPRLLQQNEMAIWMVLRGQGEFARDAIAQSFTTGDVVLIPAESAETLVWAEVDCDILHVTVPERPIGDQAE